MNIHTLDLNFQGRPQTIASYLLVAAGGPVLVETGPGSTFEILKQQLAAHGFSPGDIGHVLVTHIHLDHAGAAGLLAQQGAQLYVHHVGAPHLIDPSRLVSSAGRIYGHKMDTLWGQIVPAPPERVTAVYDGDIIEVEGLRFQALDTPGHAGHHHVFVLDDLAFTGDALGVRLPKTGFIDIPAPPPEFNLETWRQTLARLRGCNFKAIYPTHYGRVDDWRAHLEIFSGLLEETAVFVREQLEAGAGRDEILRHYRRWEWARAQQVHLPESDFNRYDVVNPFYMSVDGIIRYWQKINGSR